MARWIGGGSTSSAAGTLNVKNFGAVGDGVTDDSAAFTAAVAAAQQTASFLPYSLGSDPYVTTAITVPPGRYLITNPAAFLGDETPTAKDTGISWRGAGRSISQIIFKPTATGQTLAFNDYHLSLSFHDLGFWAATASSTFMQSYTTHNAQRYLFFNCDFRGWKYIVDLQGDNNNSEYAFYYCHSSGIQNDGSWLRVGSTNTSDQFLNYWFYGCTHWSTSAPLIDMARGGHVHIYGLDASDWGAALTSPGYLFYLRDATHALGICDLEVNGLRVEAKSANAGLIFSQWPQGNVVFNNTDWASQSGTYTYGDIISIEYINVRGPMYTFRDSTLAGRVRVKFAGSDWQFDHRITFENCDWLQKTSPSDAVFYDTTGNVNPLSLPPVNFVRCRGPIGNVYNAAGAATWDARIGYRGQALQTLTPRVLSSRTLDGIAWGGDNEVIVLPIGALITGIRVLSPAGAVTEADGGTWSLVTTEATPTTVATVTVAGALSAGFDATTNLTVPFECTTAARAKLAIKDTNVAQANQKALLLIHGYW